MRRRRAASGPGIAERLLLGTLAGVAAAVGAAVLIARLGPGDPLDRAVFAGLLVPLVWAAAIVRALFAPRRWRVVAEPVVVGVLATAAGSANLVLGA